MTLVTCYLLLTWFGCQKPSISKRRPIVIVPSPGSQITLWERRRAKFLQSFRKTQKNMTSHGHDSLWPESDRSIRSKVKAQEVLGVSQGCYSADSKDRPYGCGLLGLLTYYCIIETDTALFSVASISVVEPWGETVELGECLATQTWKHFGKSDSIFVWFGTEAEGVGLCSHGADN